MKTIQSKKQSGASLVVVMSVLATLMVVVAVAAEYTYTVNRHVERSNTLQNAITVGDNCVEILFTNWRRICSASGNVTTDLATDSFNGIALPTAPQLNLPTKTHFAKAGQSIDPDLDELDSDYTISNFKVVAVNPEWRTLSAANEAPKPALGMTADSANPNTTAIFNYIASADVTLPALGPGGKVVAKVRRVFQKQQLSPWNFAIFFTEPLEIHPGPQFTVTGWVHTNSDLYTGHNTLTFADKVTYGSDWFVGFMPGEKSHVGETPTAPKYVNKLPPARDQALQPFGLDSTSIFDPEDRNPNNDSYRELIEQSSGTKPDPLDGQRYYEQAAIRILIASNNSVTIKKLDDTTVTSSSTGNNLKLYNAVNNALTTGATIQDNREGASVRLAGLDVAKLVTSLTNSSTSSTHIDSSLWNGIIYVADQSASATVHRGIRLLNGKILPNNGLTVASANPVYIQGDYNTGSGTVPSNATSNNDPTRPQSSDYKRQPASVIADAVNILSNNWNDSNAQNGDDLGDRIATNTTVNTAIIGGIVPSAEVGGDGSYSGGAENFPRFLERWTNVKFTYYGSMVQLYKSEQAIGKWGLANVYDAPVRQWYFDTNFKTNPPPGSIMLYSYIKGKWSVL